ncbi:MAG: hypothetical protein IKN10_06270 [Muribaculaceae bacterium]|nr:hypothetical protein [Muribaculaceae bacterium]
MLKVITFWNDTSPALFMAMSSRYMPSGELPVGHPNLKGFSGVGFASLIRFATYFAAHFDTFS